MDGYCAECGCNEDIPVVETNEGDCFACPDYDAADGAGLGENL